MRVFTEIKGFCQPAVLCVIGEGGEAGVHLAVEIGGVVVADAKALVVGWSCWVDLFDGIQCGPEVGAAAAAFIA